MHQPAELWKDMPEDERPPVSPLFKKIIILGAGIFIMLLMVSYIFGTFPLGDILQGRSQSSLLENKMLLLPEFSILFVNDTAAGLERLYLQEQQQEFSLCLQGRYEDNLYTITSLYQPQMYRRTFNHVSFESCAADTLIMLHSHPYKRCAASSTDLETLRQSQEQNAEVLMVVMCEPRRFAVYS